MIQAQPVNTAAERLLATVARVLSELGDASTWSVVLALAAAGTIAMAIVQLIKELTPVRRWYQQRWIDSWIDRQFAAVVSENTGERIAALTGTATEAKLQVVELSTGGLAAALYGLAADEMTVQIIQAGQITLDAPARYRTLLTVLARGITHDDLVAMLKGQPTTGSTQQYFDARNRVTRRMQRNVEGIRLALGHDWKFWMQLLSVALTALTVVVAVATQTQGFLPLLVAFPIGIIGGYFAPLTRDFVVALQRLRRPL